MLGRKTLVVLISRILAAVLGLVGLIFTSRYLGPEINGQVSWALALVTTFNSMSDFGFIAAHIKRLSEGKDQEDCVSTFVTIKLLLTVGMVAAVLIYVAVWMAVDPQALSSTTFQVILLMVLYSVFYNISSIFFITYEGRMEAVKSQLIPLAEPLSRAPLMVFVALEGLGAISLAYTYVVGGVVMAVVGALLFSREGIRWKRPTMFRPYLVFALPISLITVFGTISWNIDKLIIEAFGSTTDVAFFSQPQTILGVLGFVGVAVTTLTFPAFSMMHARGDLEGIRQVTHRAERYISMLALPVTVVIVLFPSETVVTLLGELYLPAAEPMRYLALAGYIALLSQAYVPQIGGTNRPDLSAKLAGIGLALNVGLLLVFVPASLGGITMLGLGVVGAALVNIVVSFFFLVLVRLIVYRLTLTRSNPRILLHVLAGALSGLILYLLFLAYPIQHWYDLIAYGLLEIPVFAAFLALFRELTGDDLRYLREVLNPREMGRYISDEMKDKKK